MGMYMSFRQLQIALDADTKLHPPPTSSPHACTHTRILFICNLGDIVCEMQTSADALNLYEEMTEPKMSMTTG
jgi:hypothetical protein